MTLEDEAGLNRLGLVAPERPSVDLTLKEVEVDGILYTAPTAEQMEGFIFDLAHQINQSGAVFDRIVAIVRGGLTGTREMMDLVQIPKVSSVRYERYTGTNQTQELKLVQPLTESVWGETDLLYDEIVDKGDTIVAAKKYIEEMGAKLIKTAALGYKPTESQVEPDVYAFTTTAWVVFPHERHEFIIENAAKWKAKGLSINQAAERLLAIGIPFKYIDDFLEKSWALAK